jgi:hypothetical protein
MNTSVIPTQRRTGAIALIFGLFAGTTLAWGQSGPFSTLGGTWSGTGQISFADGRNERVRCTSDAAVGEGGNHIEQSLRCASDSYNFQLHSNAANRGGQISGTWSESTRNLSGNLAGRANGNTIQVRADAGTFAVALTLVSSGNSQQVTIQPQGQGEITGVAVKLTRRGQAAR